MGKSGLCCGRRSQCGIGMSTGGRGRIGEGKRVMMRDGLELEGMLLGMICWEDLVEYDESAVAIPG